MDLGVTSEVLNWFKATRLIYHNMFVLLLQHRRMLP